MVVATYAPVGGLWFPFALTLVALGLLFWVAYWLRREFRASPARSLSGRIARLVIAASIVIVTTMFPPMRRTADWTDVGKGIAMTAKIAAKLDRSLFGYIPSYRWIGDSAREEPFHCTVTIFECRSYIWVIDWSVLVAEVIVLGALLAPFLRARDS